MKYLNHLTALGQHDMVLSASLQQLGAWWLLQCYCHTQMNGGCITNCRDWPDEKWHRICGASTDLLLADCTLWHWTPMLLVVHLYDTHAEEAYRKKQAMGRIYIERRWAAERQRKIIQIGSGNSEKSGNAQKKTS